MPQVVVCLGLSCCPCAPWVVSCCRSEPHCGADCPSHDANLSERDTPICAKPEIDPCHHPWAGIPPEERCHGPVLGVCRGAGLGGVTQRGYLTWRLTAAG